MSFRNGFVSFTLTLALSGCAVIDHAFCVPSCNSEAHNSSSLVNFLYPHGELPPSNNTIPELRVPLRVGLAFLPSQNAGPSPISAAQKEKLLESIRQHFSSRKFVSEIVVIPDYYLANNRGYQGLEGVQRLYNIDVMALVSYDQVTHTEDNKLSLAYFTILGAYVFHGSSHDTATLVDLAVVDSSTRSLIIRAGGTSESHGASALIDVDKATRLADTQGFDDATQRMIGNFDAALTKFQDDVHNGRSNVKVIARDGGEGHGGSGSIGLVEILALTCLVSIGAAYRKGSGSRPM